VQRPLGEGPDSKERDQEGQDANGEAGPKIGPKGYGVDFRPGQEGQDPAAQHGQEVGPFGGMQQGRMPAPVKVPHGHPHKDLHQGHGNAQADGQQAGQEGQAHPERGDEPDVLDHLPRSLDVNYEPKPAYETRFMS
jgi:hypothetical protein